MPRYAGKIGYYTGNRIQSEPGVYEEEVKERPYRGDIQRVSRKTANGETVNPNVSVNHQVSIVGDAYAFNNFFNIRYVWWAGVKWLVGTIEVARPRLILYIGSEFEDANQS